MALSSLIKRQAENSVVLVSVLFSLLLLLIVLLEAAAGGGFCFWCLVAVCDTGTIDALSVVVVVVVVMVTDSLGFSCKTGTTDMLKAGVCVVVHRMFCRSPWNNGSSTKNKETFKRPVKITPPASKGKAVASLTYLLNRFRLGTTTIF